MNGSALDEIDQKIIAWLSKDARSSNREIAHSLGLAEGTIRGRIRRLQDENIIKITAVTNIVPVETPMMAYIGIRADLKRLTAIAECLSELEFIRFVATMLGRYDILAITVVSSPEELVEKVNSEIMAISGVRHADTTLATKILKYDYRWGRILSKRANS